MLRFIVMRHAKSVPATVDLPDHERPLSSRGQRDAPEVARVMTTLSWTPDRVLCSDSRRTRETWEHMIGGFTEPPPVRFSRQLYLPSLRDFETIIGSEHGDARTLMTLAHNPGCEDLVRYLCDVTIVMKTSYAALMQTSADRWADALRPGAFTLVDVLGPPPRNR